MSVKSVLRGWECEECGINRNEANEVWEDCLCEKNADKETVEKSNETYWEKFWNRR